LQAKAEGIGSKQPDKGDEQINQQGFAPAVGRKENNRAAPFHQTDGIEAINGWVKKKAQGVVGQMIKAEKESDEGNGNKSRPKPFTIDD
jgi:hypothetical protein